MVSTTPCCARRRLSAALALALAGVPDAPAWSQASAPSARAVPGGGGADAVTDGTAPGPGGTPTAASGMAPAVLRIAHEDGAWWLSAQVRLALPAPVADALAKGLPLHFVAQAQVVRKRWYWWDQVATRVLRRMRLSVLPLTQRWRLTSEAPPGDDVTPGLTLSQTFDTLDAALNAVGRVARWRLAEDAELSPQTAYVVQFRLGLDTDALPRPLVIGTLGQSDWAVGVSLSQALVVGDS